MFDLAWSTVRLVETPVVGWQALRNLKLLFANASNNDSVAKEAEGFEGGPDATDTESKTTSIGTVPSIHSDSAMESNAIGLATKDDPVAITIDPSVLGKPTRPPGEGGRR
jgi:hypothetical protein